MIIIDNYGMPEIVLFVKKVLRKTPNKKLYNLDKDITIEEWDLDRIYLHTDGFEFTIRTWDLREDHTVPWTFFVCICDPDGGGHGEELSCGVSLFDFSE